MKPLAFATLYPRPERPAAEQTAPAKPPKSRIKLSLPSTDVPLFHAWRP